MQTKSGKEWLWRQAKATHWPTRTQFAGLSSRVTQVHKFPMNQSKIMQACQSMYKHMHAIAKLMHVYKVALRVQAWQVVLWYYDLKICVFVFFFSDLLKTLRAVAFPSFSFKFVKQIREFKKVLVVSSKPSVQDSPPSPETCHGLPSFSHASPWRSAPEPKSSVIGLFSRVFFHGVFLCSLLSTERLHSFIF